MLPLLLRGGAAGVMLLALTPNVRGQPVADITSTPNPRSVPQAILLGGVVVPLYPEGASQLNAARTGELERYTMTDGVPGRIQSVSNIHNPSLELHRADPKFNTGTLVILLAGGAHRTLNVGTEAADLVHFFYNLGVNTAILRNRLRADGYDVNIQATSDVLQAIRIVRSRAKDWRLDPLRVGVMGFSAGAELAAQAGLAFDFPSTPGGISQGARQNLAPPNFVALLYPGPTAFSRDPSAQVPHPPPAAFVASAGTGDRAHAIWALEYVTALVKQGVPNVELHIYGRGVHANGIKDRDGTPFGTWHLRFVDWFRDLGFLQAPGRETKALREARGWHPSASPSP